MRKTASNSRPLSAQVYKAVSALSLAGMLLMAGCGFHLRGQLVLPENLQQVRLSCPGNNSRQLCLNIRDYLQDANIQVVDAGTDSSSGNIATLNIGDIRDQRRVVSIGSDAGVAEYELNRSVRFSFIDDKGEAVIPDTQTSQFQTYQFDDTSVLGKDKEEEQIREELDQLLARDILNRVAVSAARL